MADDDLSSLADAKPAGELQNGISSNTGLIHLGDDKMEPIAVIGFAARLPGDATSAEGFWQMLSEGRSARTEIPKDRFNIDAFYHSDNDRIDTTNVRTGNFLAGDIAAFDAPFFSIQPTEVASMDPQQRIMLETSYWALENSGLSMESVIGSKTCVYVGTSSRDYEALLLRDPESPAKYLGTGIGTSMLANRVSWFYDLQGSSVALDTACSSGLSALHLACQSLRSHESNMGLVGGCSLILAPDVSMIHLSNMGFFSPDGRCYTFDERANGYAKGEGAGVVVIKLLADALRDGNTIRAVIRATGVNQDGKTPGLTQPSKVAQQQNIQQTYRAGGLDPDVTKYFEAHGTGTQVGDPIEAEAISAAFQKRADDPLYIGAVKPNIGHLEAGSGVASLIKAVLVLEKGRIPPNINFERPNVNIPTEKWHIKFPLETIPWPTDGLRRASVNSFGYGGSNAHCVLDDAFNYLELRGIEAKRCIARSLPLYVSQNRTKFGMYTSRPLSNGHGPIFPSQLPKVLIWAASDEEGLRRLAIVYQAHMSKLCASTSKDIEVYMDDLAFTLSNKRSMLPWKAFIVASSIQELGQNLTRNLSKPVRSSTAPTLSFVFTGQGAQWAGMGGELLAYSVFEASLRRSERYLKALGCEWALIDELQKDKALSEVDTPAIAQPLCTALQIALVDLLSSWKIFPAAVTGHSSGEIAAAYCASSLSHESALKVAFYRGALAARLAKLTSNPRAMASVALSQQDIALYLTEVTDFLGKGQVTIGCVNSPNNVTVTGDLRCVEALCDLMDDKGIFARKLQVNVAYHSSYMKEIAAEYSLLIEDIVPRIEFSSSRNPCESPVIFSSVTGTRLEPEIFSRPEYWVTNMVSTVRFVDSLGQMSTYLLNHRPSRKSGRDLLVEIGPTAALQRPVKDTIDEIAKSEDIGYDSILKRDVSGLESCLGFTGRLRCSGYKVDLTLINSPTSRKSDLGLLVDLPQYPFNHSQSYWSESRISANFRSRQHARHELLGAPSADWNPSEPKWRNIIRIMENPWIVDHKIGGSELYPAGGMIAMAIEGIRQLADPERSIASYLLEDVVFHRALLVSSASEGVETQLNFRRKKRATKDSPECHNFILYAYSSGEWSSVFEGTINMDYEDSASKVDTCKEPIYERSTIQKVFQSGVKSCTETVHSNQFYKNLSTYGYGFGPTFQCLDRIRYNDTGEAAATITLDGWKDKIPSGETQRHVIHPTAFDGLFQLGMAAISKGSWEAIPSMVPTQLKSLWVSNDLLTRDRTCEIEVYTKLKFRGYREADFWIAAMNAREEAQIVVEGWRETALNSLDALSPDESGLRSYHVEWKPALALLDGPQVSELCVAGVTNATASIENLAYKWELVSAFFMSAILKNISRAPEGEPVRLHEYIGWVRHQADALDFSALLASDPDGKRLLCDDMYQEKFFQEFAESSPEGELAVTVGRNLPGILRGEVDPNDLIFSQKLAQNFYSSPALTMSYAKIGRYVDLLAHKDPNLKIMEIGAGEGALTDPILRSLVSYSHHIGEEGNIPRFRQFVYTDVSPAYFEKAKVRFQDYSNRMSYATLDIEKDSLKQGFEPEQYDLIICGAGLHVTGKLSTNLQNARRLLKPGGKLIILQPTNPHSSRFSFIFGLLPVWWLGTDKKRKWGPMLSEAHWHERLLENGFSGAELCLPDSEDTRKHTYSIVISTAHVTNVPQRKNRKTVIVASDKSSLQTRVASEIKSSLQLAARSLCEVISLQEVASKNLKNTLCIFLPELETPFLARMSCHDFATLKAIILSADGVLWVTQGCGECPRRPGLGLVTGFGRNVRSESLGMKFVELAINIESSPSQTVNHIMKVYRKNLVLEEQDEPEYMERDGKLCISRVLEAQYLDKEIYARGPRQSAKMRSFGSDPNKALELGIGSPGLLDTLKFKDDDRFEWPIATDDVEIKVHSTGLNFKDVIIALGQYPGNHLGYECAGVVTRAGDSADFRPGDRVLCCTSTGGFNTYARSHATSTAKILAGLSFSAAAALPTAFCTAYYSLFNLAHLQEGEVILIHSGAGGVGQAAIQLAKLLKANVFTTVGTDEKKKFLMDTYGIPEDHIFSSRNTSFARVLMRMTNGVDVVLNSLSGQGMEASWSCLRRFGRFIELGKADINSHRGLPMSPFSQNVTFASVDLGLIMEEAKPTMATILNAVMALLTEFPARVAAPQPLHVYKVSDLEKAFRFMQSGKAIGKIVVEMQEGAIVPIVPSSKPSYSFERNGTYVIAGGLGGLGRSITRWMADRNAKNFILLSRSGAKGKDALELIDEMKLRGIRIAAPVCDISDEDALSTAFRDCKMPPIKGCIQASMVLKDGLFENLTNEDFNIAIKPKVQGSWNLHKHLPPNLDFFLLLSSVASITGTRGQSNYAAGNSYQDALARHRVSLGQKCISLNLGPILSIGIAAEKDLTESLERDGFVGLPKADLFALLDYSCDPSLPLRTPQTSQILTGLGGIEHDVYWARKPLFSILRQKYSAHTPSSSTAGSTTVEYARLLQTADSQAAAEDVVVEALKLKLAKGLGIPIADIDIEKAIYSFGVDSLVALELRYWFAKEMRAEVSIFDIMQSQSVLALGQFAAGKSELRIVVVADGGE